MPRLLESTVIDKQIDREMDSLKRGVERYRRLAREAIDRGQGSSLKPAERLLGHWFSRFSREIINEKIRIAKGVPGKDRNVYGPYFGSLKADEMAVIAMKDLLGLLMSNISVPLTRAAYSVGCSLNAEINIRPMRKQRSDAWAALCKKSRKILTKEHINAVARQFDEGERWPIGVCVKVGVAMIWLLQGIASARPYDEDFVQAFRIYKHRQGKKIRTLVAISDAAQELIDSGHRARQYLRPRYEPMEVRPLPWTEYGRGGYYKLRTTLVKHCWGPSASHLEDSDLSKVFTAVNALGRTPWQINPAIYCVIDQYWKDGGNLLGLPRAYELPKPLRPDEADVDADIKKQWNIEAVKWYRLNTAIRSQRADFMCRLDLAKSWVDAPKMYFPHQLDFRSRTYPINLYLHHHGDDVSRGLLRFGKAKPLGEEGLYWLKVHAASCYGFDKQPFDIRVQWAGDMMWEILKSAQDPFGHTWWHQAEKPWQMLAVAMELYEAAKKSDPTSYYSRIPVQMDGSCNGLQNYAALSRDEEGASRVNMTDNELPADIYSDILRIVEAKLERDSSDKHPIAMMLQGLIKRKTVKQPIMTTVYGVTRSGAVKQIQNQIEDLVPHEQSLKCADYLAVNVLKAMSNACRGASQLMDWLTTTAKVIAGAGRPVAWTTPLGLRCVQPYVKSKGREIVTVTAKLLVNEISSESKVKFRRQVNGFAPNFIHSIDGTHALMTATAMRQAGLDFASVHDSFWTHASSTNRMHDILRDQFIRLHTPYRMGELRTQLTNDHPDLEIPDLPDTGKLDLNIVKNAAYFFS